MVRTQVKPRHDSVNSIISNVSNSASKSSQSLSRLSSLSAANNQEQDTDLDIMPKLIIAPIIDKIDKKRKQKPSAIEMSEDRVRKLSGQIDEHQLKELIDQYDNNQNIKVQHIEDDDDGSITPSDDDEDDDNNDD